MSLLYVSHPTRILKGSIHLPSSKSISNRALILQAISKGVKLHNLSTADDTAIMQRALEHKTGEVQVKNAGTCMRFLTAYFAAQPGTDIRLLCDPRMEQRPIHMLVDALREIGADISYLKNEGFPPLHIKGKKLTGGAVKINAGISSQFISALMMIAPLCEKGLRIELTGTISSQPYIDMTGQMMREFGFDIEINYPFISILSLSNHPITKLSNYTIEPDWSAASYWYEMAALSEETEILLEGLSLESLQGDKVIAGMMEMFGVGTEENESGIMIKKSQIRITKSQIFLNHKGTKEKKSEINLVDFPDLAPTLTVTAAALNVDLTLTGLQNLVIKESNRIEAIATELTKCGFSIKHTFDSISIAPVKLPILNSQFSILTYGDHRMAMAFAPLALVMDTVVIGEPEVVEKSYPHFWEDLHKTGFNLKS